MNTINNTSVMSRLHELFNSHSSGSGLFLAGLGTAFFSCKGILIKLCYQHGATPDMVITLRMIFAFPFYLLVALQAYAAAAHAVNARQLVITALLGVVGYFLSSLLDFNGLVYISASLERIILYTYPAIVLILSIVFLQTKFNYRMALCIVVIYLGLVMVFLYQKNSGISPGSLNAGALHFTSGLIQGSLLVAGSAFTYSVYLIGTEFMMRTMPNRFYTAFAMLAASIAIFIYGGIRITADAILHQSMTIYMLTLLIAIFCTVIPSFLVSAGIQRIGAAKVGAVGTLGPIVTILLGVTVLGESIAPLQLPGFLLVIGGIYFLSQQK
jgi:drug/metabolite transporter (DMT)-like permease